MLPLSIVNFALFKEEKDELTFSIGFFVSIKMEFAISRGWKEVSKASSLASMYLKEES